MYMIHHAALEVYFYYSAAFKLYIFALFCCNYLAVEYVPHIICPDHICIRVLSCLSCS